MSGQYILVGGKPVPEPDLLKWADWFENYENRVLRQTAYEDKGIRVSTIFLGLDHNFMRHYKPDAEPILWETMIFGGKHDQYQERYASQELALEGHITACRLVEEDL